jgi:hypothetical protein
MKQDSIPRSVATIASHYEITTFQNRNFDVHGRYLKEKISMSEQQT